MTIELRYLTDEALIVALLHLEGQVHAAERGRSQKAPGSWGDAVCVAMVLAGEIWRRGLLPRYLAALAAL